MNCRNTKNIIFEIFNYFHYFCLPHFNADAVNINVNIIFNAHVCINRMMSEILI